ncbi:MAG: c-type cytochrome [Candidatus Marinimicrobia bacterium]|nr:c-type cytochrome [Candidatus Neomarinimicrobiota bacterium]
MKWINSTIVLMVSLTTLVSISACGGGDSESAKPVAETKEVTKAAPETKAIAENSAGAELYKTKTCFTCHGLDGKTPILPQYPNIAGQTKEYALQQMIDIKAGTRANGLTAAMKGIMHLVSDEEMELLAEYVATFPRREGGLSTAKDSEGAKLFKTKTCFTCHGADGKTPLLPNYPKVEGQSAEYALQQMQDIKTGVRNNAQTAAMKGIMHLVTDEEMTILATYLSTLVE